MVITATELKELLGHTLKQARSEVIMITKSNKPSVVMLSIEEYERLKHIEEVYTLLHK